ncbi:MAG: carboxylesterase family protein [Caldimonas sp.]
MRILSVIVLLTAGLALHGAAAAQMSTATTVRVGTAAGVVEAAAAEVASFRGIPYAAAPTGPLRWHSPEPAPRWTVVRPAIAFGKACPQDRTQSLDQAGDPGPTDEDCLFANVWTPRADAAARLPVMVWIHGGAFSIGAGSQTLYDGTALARRGAVVVSFNYRLGSLGFFSHPALDAARPGGPVNFGLLDQLAALRWVRVNIAAFGGDPDNVTIFGESAGAQSVLALYASPLARGLFARGIAQSAYGLPSATRAQARKVGIAVAMAVGVGGAGATLEQLRAVPAEAFATLNGNRSTTLAPSLTVGDAALPRPILATFQQGREAALPLIVGHNSDDASVIAAFGVDPAVLISKLGAARIFVKPLYPGQNDPSRLGSEVARDVVFGAFARRIAYLHSAVAPTWRYYFGYLPLSLRSTAPGVAHGGEIASVFGADERCGCLVAPPTDADRNIARRVGDYWHAFAKTGSPAPSNNVAWPSDSRATAHLLEFGDEPVARSDFMKRRFDTYIGALNLLEFFAAR